MLKSGITKRWLLTTVLIIAVILAGFAVLVIFSIRGYYYDYVSKRLQSLGQSSTLEEFFKDYIGASVKNKDFSERASAYLLSSPSLNSAEVWVYNKKGDIVVTSNGFPVDNLTKPVDYELALASNTADPDAETKANKGPCVTNLSSGEKVMALTVFLPFTDGESNGAIRYIISLEDIDNKLQIVSAAVVIVFAFALAMVLVSGSFFVRSIVVPVKKINQVTRKIATGNYDEKVQVSNRYDEISELSESINDMTDALAKTERLKNDFISTVSHELRTPLTAIKGWTETLIEINESDDKTLGDGLRVILSESERLYTMVEELLDFSRIESGRMTLHRRRIDALAELDEAVSVLKDRAEREGKELHYETLEAVAQMDGDPDRIQQVFVNIIDNAIKYTEPGGRIIILVTLEKETIEITVRDTGCGIPEDALPHVKEKFYKANMSVKGSGIGLAVCDEIVSLHGGTLAINSKEGEGTEVKITFPLSSEK